MQPAANGCYLMCKSLPYYDFAVDLALKKQLSIYLPYYFPFAVGYISTCCPPVSKTCMLCLLRYSDVWRGQTRNPATTPFQRNHPTALRRPGRGSGRRGRQRGRRQAENTHHLSADCLANHSNGAPRYTRGTEGGHAVTTGGEREVGASRHQASPQPCW